MAKKKETNFESRTLSKTLGSCAVEIDGAGVITLVDNDDGWASTLVSGGSQVLVYKIGYFDLSGYSLQDKTLFPQGVLLQDMAGAPTGLGLLASGPKLDRCTIVSTTPINVDDLSRFSGTAQNIWNPPGSPDSTHELNNILVGRAQYYATLTTLAGFQQLKESTWGSGDSTAADRLYFCDAYVGSYVVETGWNIPSQAFVIPVSIFEEPELEYMMRLARSVEPVY